MIEQVETLRLLDGASLCPDPTGRVVGETELLDRDGRNRSNLIQVILFLNVERAVGLAASTTLITRPSRPKHTQCLYREGFVPRFVDFDPKNPRVSICDSRTANHNSCARLVLHAFVPDPLG
jgi:hypothetical protein